MTLTIIAAPSWEARVFIGWFGSRGLNSLLLALLVVQAGLPGAELQIGLGPACIVISGWVGVASGSVQTRLSTPVKGKQLWKRNLQRPGQGGKISESRVSLAPLYTPNIGSMHPSTLGQRFLR